MAPYLVPMFDKRCCAYGVGIGLYRLHIGVERDFGVDGQLAPAGQVDHKVRAQRTLAIIYGELFFKIAIGRQANHFNNIAQLRFAPIAPCLGAAF